MKLKVKISSYDDLGQLIKLLGLNGLKVWREEKEKLYGGSPTYYLLMEIDKEIICKEDKNG